MHRQLQTQEKIDYCDHWSHNASHFEKQSCYTWMAEQLRDFQPKRILDIGCGSGQGLLALLSAFNPDIVCLEENAECIRTAGRAIDAKGHNVEVIFRLGYEEFSDGTHSILFDQSPIRRSAQVSLVHADALVDDPEMLRFLGECPPFDAVTVWLMGTYRSRETCRNIANLKIVDTNEYRLRVQNRVYEFADKVLRPGGHLQVVDRGEPPSTEVLAKDLADSHRDQAKRTSLEVVDLQYKIYREPTARGISMVASIGTSGRIVDLKELAMTSIVSRKMS